MPGIVAAARTHLLLGSSYLMRMAAVAALFVLMSYWMGSPILMVMLTAFVSTMLGMYLAGFLVGSPVTGRYFAGAGFRRRDIVGGLFGASLIALGVGTGVMLLLAWVIERTVGSLGALAPVIGLGVLVAVAFLALSVPLILKVGPERARLYILIPAAALMAAVPVMDENALFSWIATAGAATVTFAALGAGVFLIALSWLVSARVYAGLDI